MNTLPTDEQSRLSELRTRHEEPLPIAAANVVESAVQLAKAEVTLALVEARQWATGSLRALSLLLVTALLLPGSIISLTLGSVLQTYPAPWWHWIVIASPSVLMFGTGIAAIVSLRKVMPHARQR